MKNTQDKSIPTFSTFINAVMALIKRLMSIFPMPICRGDRFEITSRFVHLATEIYHGSDERPDHMMDDTTKRHADGNSRVLLPKGATFAIEGVELYQYSVFICNLYYPGRGNWTMKIDEVHLKFLLTHGFAQKC